MSNIRLRIAGESFWGFQYDDLPKNQAEINNHLESNIYAFGDRVEFDEDGNVTKLIKTRAEVLTSLRKIRMTNKTMKPIEQTAVECDLLAEIDGHILHCPATPEKLTKFAELYFATRCAEMSEPVAWRAEFSGDPMINNGSVYYRYACHPSTYHDCKQEPLYLAPQPSQDADYVKRLEDALEMAKTKVWGIEAVEQIEQALANKPLVKG